MAAVPEMEWGRGPENPASQILPRGLPPVRLKATDEPGGGGNEQATSSTRGTRPLPAIQPPECLASTPGDNAEVDWGRVAAKGTAQRSGDPGAIFVYRTKLSSIFFWLKAPSNGHGAQEQFGFATPSIFYPLLPRRIVTLAMTLFQLDEGEGHRKFPNRLFSTSKTRAGLTKRAISACGKGGPLEDAAQVVLFLRVNDRNGEEPDGQGAFFL